MLNIILDKEIKAEKHPDEPDFDSPNGSKWIVAVDVQGNVTVLETPNIHDCLLEKEHPFGFIGFPCDSESDPGVYEWTCSYHEHTDWETGQVDDYEFEVESEKLLWEPK